MKKNEYVIELGSCNVKIFKKDVGLVLIEPTVALVESDLKKPRVKHVGHDAQKRIGKISSSIEVVYPIKTGLIDNKEVAEELLKNLLKKAGFTKKTTLKSTFYFVTGFGMGQDDIQKFKSLAYSTGAGNVYFIYESVSSVFNMIFNKPSIPFMSVNIGAGKTDISIVNDNSIIDGVTIFAGGLDIDIAIKDYVAKYQSLEISLKQSEKIKNEIASLYSNDTRNIEVLGFDLESKTPIRKIISSSDIYPVVRFFFENIAKKIEQILNKSSSGIISEISDEGLYFSGGTSSIWGLDNYLGKRLGVPINIHPNHFDIAVITSGKAISSKRKRDMILKY